jgi:CubicO group peptidase (beta-lactamase class C family)
MDAWTLSTQLATELSRLADVHRFDVPADLEAITRVAPVEVRQTGLDPAAVERVWAAVRELYKTGIFPAIGLCVLRDGQPVIDRTIGFSHGVGPGAPPDAVPRIATPDTPFCVFSASKAITATVVHMLDDRGLLHVDDRVSEYIPEFAQRGKENITIRHVLTHRAGLPSLRAEGGLQLLLRPDEVVRMLCEMEPSSPPGRRLAYHAITGGFILGEVVRRVTGKDIQDVLRDELTAPLGLDQVRYGWFPGRSDEVAQNWFTGPRVRWPLSALANKALGIPFEDAPIAGNSAEWLGAVVPAGNIVAPGRQIARFFDMLRCEGTLDGVRVLNPRTVRRAVIETSWLEVDFTLLLPVRYGVGFMLGAPWLGVFGPDTDRAFGHLGLTNVFCWADPARRISVTLNTTGKPLFSGHLVQLSRLLGAISQAFPKSA